MKKNLFNLRKGRWLLLMLLSLIFGGGNSAWAETVTADFNNQSIPDGWEIKGNLSYDDSRRYGNSGYGLTNTLKTLNTSNYLVTEVLTGNVTYYFRRYASGSSAGTGYLYIYEVDSDGNLKGDALDSKTSTSTSMTQYTYNIGSDSKSIAIVLVNATIDNVSGTKGSTSVNEPSMKVSATSYDFGLTTAGTTTSFKITNNGNTDYTISASATEGFITSLSTNTLNKGEEATLTVTMPSATANGVVTIHSSDENIADKTINVSGTIKDTSVKNEETFSGTSIPNGWTQTAQSTSWTSYSWDFSNEGYASYNGSISYAGTLTSPKMIFSSGEKIYFEVMKFANNQNQTAGVTVKVSTDGTTFNNIATIANSDITYDNWKSFSATIPSADIKYICFECGYLKIRNIYGGVLVVAPKNLAVMKAGTSATLSWTAANTETAWQVFASTDANAIDNATPTPVNTTPSYTFEGLTPGSSYYAWVRSIFGEDSFSDWSRASFSLTYQSAAPTSIDKNGITNVTFGSGEEVVNSSDRPTSSPFYGDYSSQIGGVTVGQSSNLAITFGTGYTYGTVVWVDWNQNYEFEDSEIVFAGESTKSNPTTLDASFTVPVTQAIGYYRMRIAAADSYYDNHKTMATAAGADPNPTGTYTVVHDYTLKVNEASSYALSISGSDVVNNAIAFGTVKNTTTTKTFTIVNDGGNDLTGVTVTSSDSEVFTVSDTNFDIPVGGSKEITVTFVKAVDGDYNETITVSQTNVSDQVITVTATYATPTPATMDVTLDDAAVPATVEFGTVGKATTKTFKVANTGEATLNATIAVTGTDVANFTLSSNALEVEGGSEGTFTVTFDATDYDVEKTATITLTAGELNKSFGVTGTRGDFWIEDFEGGAIPEGWDNSGFVVTTGTVGNYPTYILDSYVAVGYGGDAEKTLITPLLKASAGDKLTFDGFFYYGDETFKVDYSADLSTWNNLYTYDKSSYSSGTTNKIEIESAITGEFYLRFTVNYYNGIDNIVGFKLAPKKEHEAVIEASNIPATGNQYVEYEATVTVKEKAGKDDENVMAELWIGNKKVANTTATLTANGDKVITLTFTPDESMSGDAYIKVYNDNVDLTTGTQAVTISAAPVWSELAEENPFSEGTYTVAVLDYTPKAGWNTIALPFGVSDLTIFGTGVKAFEYNGFSENKLKFKTVTSLVNFTPYLLYVETPVTEDIILRNVSISATGANPSNCTTVHDGVTFQGVYAKTTAGDIYNKHAVTTAGQIGKCSQTATLKAFRAYFDGIPANANARISLDDDDMTTAIESLLMDDSNTDVYNLNGQKIQVPQKGLYIINGKKVVIK